jgi:nucleoside-diphosphate-sugar epimerase
VILASMTAGLLLAGCSDATGDVDALGHNGYDILTCTQAKALALDIEHGTITVASVQDRIDDVQKNAAKASAATVRLAAQSLVTAYLTRNSGAAQTATTSLLRACQM